MGLTRISFAGLNTNLVQLSDRIISLNYGNTSANTDDVGIIYSRGSSGNVALVWSESTTSFRTVYTSSNGIPSSNLTITSNADLSTGNLSTSGNITIIDADKNISHGDALYNTKQYVLYGTTTSATETEIFVGGTSNSRIPVSANTTVFYEVSIAARRTDSANESAGWELKAVADNFSGTVADVGSVYEIAVARDDATWLADARADDTNNSINIYVSGATGKTIRWIAVVKTIEVGQ